VEGRKNRLEQWLMEAIILAFLVGIIVMWKVRIEYESSVSPTSTAMEYLILLNGKLENERDKLQKEIKALRGQLEIYAESSSRGESLLKALSSELVKAKMEAGLVPVEGPGVVITLKDSTRKVSSGEDFYFFLIHDMDLRLLVNELWAAGAEAISINDQRIGTRTSIRCIGSTILINTYRAYSPYVVKAIGASDKLESALKMPGGYLDSLAMSILNGVEINIRKEDNIIIPAYTGAIDFTYANMIKQENEK